MCRSVFSRHCMPLAVLVFLSLSGLVHAQLSPAEGAIARYRLAGFSVPEVKGAGTYVFEVADGIQNTENTFSAHLIKTVTATGNKAIIEVPAFGRSYTWRAVCKSPKGVLKKDEFHHFGTMLAPYADTFLYRLRVLKPTEQYKDNYVFVDANRALYDMAGNIVWIMPQLEDATNGQDEVRDLKLTPQHTITFLTYRNAYEIDYNGKVLWKGPGMGFVSGDTSEHFHHELTRLSNGHYMVLSNEIALPDANREDHINSISTLIEYDEAGKVVWFWKSSDYLKHSDIVNYRHPAGNHEPDAHVNSFYFDEQAGMIYVSFRDIDRIIKIEYPAGRVVRTYGEIYAPGKPVAGNGQFCLQHSIRRTEGELYLFNNNTCHPTDKPTVAVFEEPADDSGSLKKIWEYECPGPVAPKRIGGNVLELPDRSFFVSSCNPAGQVFIVNRDKKVLWSVVPEKRASDTENWAPSNTYRASIVSQKDLEALIWGAR